MITNLEKWNRYVAKNTDPYGKACVDIARRVMEILDGEKDFEPHNIITKAEKDVGEDGITGFMAGVISLMIAQCHSRGEEFKKKWNKGYTNKDIKGVINPAIITIKDK